MKRVLILVGVLFALATGVAAAQTRVGVSLSFGDPYFDSQVVIGRPYYPHYYRYYPYYYRVVEPRYYPVPRVVVVRRYRFHPRRFHRGW